MYVVGVFGVCSENMSVGLLWFSVWIWVLCTGVVTVTVIDHIFWGT